MKSTALKLIAAVTLMFGFEVLVKAQTAQPLNVVTTAVPFLRISPDARSGGMGDLSIATSPDASSSYFNLGKVPFNTSQGGINITYTPWLRQLVNDVYLASMAGYYKLGENQAISASLRYFNLGSIQFTDSYGNIQGTGFPKEFGVDLGYSRKLSDKLGLGIGLKYIYSNLAAGAVSQAGNYKAGTSVAGDIGLYSNNTNDAGQGWSFGVALTNLGAKISYTDNPDQSDFIPANLGLGTTFTRVLDESNKITFGLDLNKLLVPMAPSDSQGLANYHTQGVMSSWFKSFSDPGGFNEQLKEFQVSLGAEYWYNNQFALRAGYFYEDQTKGNRRYFTTGIGIKYNVFGLNFSYLIPSGSGNTQNPLSNTLRFSLIFDFNNSESSGGSQ